jgi:DNA-binding transcriptional LysR family regulator
MSTSEADYGISAIFSVISQQVYWCAAPVPLSAIFPTTRERSPKVQAFLQCLQENLRL